MKKIEHVKNLSYGIYLNREADKRNVYDYVQKDTWQITLPLGEIIFTTMEAIDYLNTIVLSGKKTDFSSYFYDKEYNLGKIFELCEIDNLEIRRLKRIKDFIGICSEKKEYCSLECLHNLTASLYSGGTELNYLFSKTGRYRLRQIVSKNKLAFGVSTTEIESELEKQYTAFSFHTRAKFSLLSELCILGLYEIFNLNLIIRKCFNCKNFFISELNEKNKFCNRPLNENDFIGCKKYKAYLYNKSYRKDDVIRLYKKTYNKLQLRTRSNLRSDIKLFEDFKNGWLTITREAKARPDKSIIQKNFLTMERWK